MFSGRQGNVCLSLCVHLLHFVGLSPAVCAHASKLFVASTCELVLDQARPLVEIAPVRHVERLTDLTVCEMRALWQAAAAVVGAECGQAGLDFMSLNQVCPHASESQHANACRASYIFDWGLRCRVLLRATLIST